MKRRTQTMAVAIVAILLAFVARGALAGTLEAKFTALGNFPAQQVSFSFPGSLNPSPANAVLSFGHRQDLPLNPPVEDDLVPEYFDAFCVEMGQSLGANTIYEWDNVVYLSGASTNPFGDPANVPVFFDATRTLLLSRLWGAYYSPFTVGSSPALAASFQLAVWELTFDTGASLSGGDFQSSDPFAAAQAQTWLTSVASNAVLLTQPLLLITDSERQDMITPAPEPAFNTPEPAGFILAAVAALGLLTIRARYRRADECET